MTLTAPDLRYRRDSAAVLDTGATVYHEHWPVETSGPTLVFVNNFYVVGPMWRTYTERIREAYGCVFYDLENQGGSSANPGPTIAAHAQTLKALVTDLGLGEIILVGTSSSSLIVREYARRFTDDVRAVVLVGPSTTPSNHPVRRATERALVNSLTNGGTEALWDHLYSMAFSAAAMREMGAPGYLGLRAAFTAIHRRDPMLANMVAAAREKDDFAVLAELGIPVALVLGSLDTLWPQDQVDEAREVLADVPGLQIYELTGAGHLPYMEKPEEFQDAVLAFLAQEEQR
ncbi:alpha/beta fold hydrolase [Cellulomonas sp. URHD0024]|uniref:alpha/beta fold hydrolase n=1 Tax=Cellulomonas sp. URHD0024 TaxID=1302620 RepID=UPI000416DFF2|nr:alpha/beta hydrolase [Cellulomonas sp. URHD0024]